MFLIYSILLTLAFVALSPMLALRREKYASGFWQRMGWLPDFDHDGVKVVWLHCVSVGEVNAAQGFVKVFQGEFPGRRLVVSTTTRTGQELAGKLFRDNADLVFYFPFDWCFSVRKALGRIRPEAVLLMETEIWPNFIREAKRQGAHVVILNGRLSERSFNRYSRVGFFIGSVLSHVDLALMQAPRDTERMTALGVPSERTVNSGNMKFDQSPLDSRNLTEEFAARFGLDGTRRFILAASTHEPEEKWLIEAFREVRKSIQVRLMLAPRHPERFDRVAELVLSSGFTLSRRSAPSAPGDASADIVLLDSIGELRSAYPLADLVFCGGSLIPHGGQSMLEPAVEGKAVLTGPFTHNFANAVEVFTFHDGLVQIAATDESAIKAELSREIFDLLNDDVRRLEIGGNARDVMERNRGATERTVAELKRLLDQP